MSVQSSKQIYIPICFRMSKHPILITLTAIFRWMQNLGLCQKAQKARGLLDVACSAIELTMFLFTSEAIKVRVCCRIRVVTSCVLVLCLVAQLHIRTNFLSHKLVLDICITWNWKDCSLLFDVGQSMCYRN